jgi:hypothetical protein
VDLIPPPPAGVRGDAEGVGAMPIFPPLGSSSDGRPFPTALAGGVLNVVRSEPVNNIPCRCLGDADRSPEDCFGVYKPGEPERGGESVNDS